MPDENSGGNPPGEAPSNPAPMSQSSMASSGTANSQREIETTKNLAKDVHWITHATFWSQVGLGLIGLIALWIYHGQLVAMQDQLDEMKRSGDQSTQQMWSAIGNINWEARSMDWSQKSTQKAMGEEVAKLQVGAEETARLATATEKASQNAIDADRPWIGLTDYAVTDFDEGQTPTFRIILTNTGRRPALVRVVTASANGFEVPTSVRYDLSKVKGLILAMPGAPNNDRSTLPKLPLGYFRTLALRQETFFFVGQISYTDVLTQKTYITHVCLQRPPVVDSNSPPEHAGFYRCDGYQDAN